MKAEVKSAVEHGGGLSLYAECEDGWSIVWFVTDGPLDPDEWLGQMVEVPR